MKSLYSLLCAILILLTFSGEVVASEVKPVACGPGACRDIDWSPYMKMLQLRAIPVWRKRYGKYKTLNVVVLFSISTDGTISKIRLDKSSNNNEADAYALEVIKNLEKMPLPHGAPSDVDIQLTFCSLSSEKRNSNSNSPDLGEKKEESRINPFTNWPLLINQPYDQKLNVSGLHKTEFPGVYKLQSGNSNNRLINGLDPSIIILPGR
jgi:TonB family protein